MEVETLAPPVLISDQGPLDRLAGKLVHEPRLAVDTESNSLHAYRERVCLMQFSTPEADYVVDPLALDDLNPLGPLFSNPHIEKVFHAAEYDLICLRRDFGFSFANLFDTMHAARILGHTAVGLDHLLAERFGIEMNKRLQKADWGARPLSMELLAYARLDTRFLLPLRDLLKVDLEARGLWGLAAEDFARACEEEPQETRPAAAPWTRVKRTRELSPRELTTLNELCLTRERIAEKLNRPPFKVMDDRVLIQIAQLAPRFTQELEGCGLSSKQVERWGAQLVEAVRRGEGAPLVRRPSTQRTDEVILKRLDKLKDWRKKAAKEMKVESDIVLPRPLLTALAEGGPGQLAAIMARSPWRLQHFGPQILQVLQAVP